jgi:hypothetical protein
MSMDSDSAKDARQSDWLHGTSVAASKLPGVGLGGAVSWPDLEVPEPVRYAVWALLFYAYVVLPAVDRTYDSRRNRRRFKAGN